MPPTRFPPRRARAAIALALGSALAASAAGGATIRRLEFLGMATLPHRLVVGGTPVGGLSALAWDAERELFYVLSDDFGEQGPARFYSVRLDLASGRLAPDGARVEGVTLLRDLEGRFFALHALDPEGLALSPQRTLLLASEGHVDTGVPPLLAEVGLDGRLRRYLPLAERFRPRTRRPWRRGATGVRHNLALESLTLSPDGRWLFTANESALYQDGPTATTAAGSPVRVSQLEPVGGKTAAEYLYLTEPVARVPVPEDGFSTAGLVELLALGGDRLLALERSYSEGAGNTIRLFEIALAGAHDVSGVESLGRQPGLRPVTKRLLLDLAEVGIPPDNLEGLAFGPPLADGRRTLVLVSDDNFSPRQTTQFLAFAFDTAAASIADVQGPDHRSPLDGQWVFGIQGVVSAVAPGEDGVTLWVQGGEAGLRVESARAPEVAPGDRVLVDGRVVERARPGALPRTSLIGARVDVVASRGEAPPPTLLGNGGRAIPAGHVDDDGLARFEPEDDAIDFFESLEGMAVEIADALVVGPGNRFGECVVLADGGAGAGPRTRRGGLRLAPRDPNPERVIVSTALVGKPCRAAVGSRFTAPLRGVLDYDFGSYRLLVTAPLPPTTALPAAAAPPLPADGPEALTVATFNVENLHPGDEELPLVARVIARDLGAPGVVALQEIQDDSGPLDDGTTAADATFRALIDAVADAGGPRYEYHQIDPVDGADGGQPGGNIRVGFLVDPRRVAVIRRPGAAAEASVEVRVDDRGPLLAPNPGRVAATDRAFAEDPERGYRATRKPLALEIEHGGRRVFLINAHLKSKRGDDPLFGARQPPRLVTEEQRSLQAARVRELADQILGHDPGAAVVVLGDLNDHEFRGPLAVLATGGLVNLIEWVPEEDRYTFNYRGNSQVLDHILVSPALVDGAEITILHLHADFPVPRASDHDPALARLPLAAPAPRD